eukprot:CAMPEP_0175090554 /NCGR_PEP_ID=MMETSP0086_2-20121207/1409_1 /TAXON_ID=136419 /ORGANISM="Unknown Unknown, Strain D1" /LENGTH=332 /DNA_ID=CAMNT_0016363193 /DNA_START=266 /DNA_END=1264 /DNA_ORIENTATION=+
MSIDPNIGFFRDCLNPNLRLSFKGSCGHTQRVKYTVNVVGWGVKTPEIFVRYQLGGIAGNTSAAAIPKFIETDAGWEVATPFLTVTWIPLRDFPGASVWLLGFSCSLGVLRLKPGVLQLAEEPTRRSNQHEPSNFAKAFWFLVTVLLVGTCGVDTGWFFSPLTYYTLYMMDDDWDDDDDWGPWDLGPDGFGGFSIKWGGDNLKKVRFMLDEDGTGDTTNNRDGEEIIVEINETGLHVSPVPRSSTPGTSDEPLFVDDDPSDGYSADDAYDGPSSARHQDMEPDADYSKPAAGDSKTFRFKLRVQRNDSENNSRDRKGDGIDGNRPRPRDGPG